MAVKTLEKENKTFHSLDEVRSYYFPNTVLQTLEEKVCERFNLNQGVNSSVRLSKENPKTGILEFSKYNKRCAPWSSPIPLLDVSNLIKSHYELWGYKINFEEGRKGDLITVAKDHEKYRVRISENRDSYQVDVSPVH